MIRETHLHPDQLVQPLFVKEGIKERQSIESMPGQFRWAETELPQQARVLWDGGIRSVLLFGIPQHKDLEASQAYARDGIVQRAVQRIKAAVPEFIVMADVCLCEYMEHGHCGIVDEQGCILNDSTLELLAKTAVSHAEAGADLVAPSDMMDGRVGAIRWALDAAAFTHIPIMSYAVKYASAFYGPFRDAVESTPQFGDRRSHQMDGANIREALREAQLDEEEGADILLVKPALPYLDVIRALSNQSNLPIAAYQVSGEFAMIEAAAQKGWLDRGAVIKESLLAIKRAGAQLIITYWAHEVAQKLSDA